MPTNRSGHGSGIGLAQLEITHEVIAPGVPVRFAVFNSDRPFKLDFLRAGLCLVGAGSFTFRT